MTDGNLVSKKTVYSSAVDMKVKRLYEYPALHKHLTTIISIFYLSNVLLTSLVLNFNVSLITCITKMIS